MKQGKRFLSVLLTLALLAALIPAAVPAAAISIVLPIAYIDETGTTTLPGKRCIIISSNDTKDKDFTWNDDNDCKAYAVMQNVTYDRRVTVEGDVVLILCDGATLTAKGGLRVQEGSSLTVFAQSKGTGKLIADAPATISTINAAGIGGGYQGKGGTVNIYGGMVEAAGDPQAAGIGGGYGGDGGTVNIYGGTVTATGGSKGAGIGGGTMSAGGTVNIYGGTVTAAGGDGAAGIGGGRRNTSDGLGGEGGTVNIYGGEVTAIGGSEGAGIGGGLEGEGAEVSIYGGKVTAYSRRNGAGIGGGYDAGGKKLTVYGGTVEATGSGSSAAIGAGDWSSREKKGGTILLYGGTITAQSGGSGIGIGGGYHGAGTTVEIRDAAVTAEGGGGAFRCYDLSLSGELDVFAPKDAEAPVEEDRKDACGQSSVRIVPYASYLDTDGSVKKQYEYTPVSSSTKTLSGGWYAVSGEVTVNERIDVTGDAKLILRDGAHLNAAKGVRLPENNDIRLTVYGQRDGTGKLTASAPKDCAGIGGNKNENGGTLTVNGGVITATGGDYGAGVGGGDTGSGGTVTVTGGALTATGKNGAAGIGGGDYGNGGPVTVTGGTVTATGSTRVSTDSGSNTGQAAAGIGAGRPKVDGRSPRSSGTFIMTGGVVIAAPGTPNDSGTHPVAAQAIGVNLDDADKNGNGGADRISLSEGLRVSVDGEREPKAAAERAGGCRSTVGIRIEPCALHRFTGETCDWCGLPVFQPVVTFRAGYDGADPAEATQDVTYNTPTALTKNGFEREGFAFTGWNTKPDGSGTPYADGAEVTLTEDLTLYARWKTAEYTITWKNDDGRVIDQTTVEYGKTPTHAPAEKEPTPEFIYIFKGWTPEIKAATGEATYTARYEEAPSVCRVIFRANDGTDAFAEQEMPYGTTTPLTISLFERAGRVQTGWNTEPDGSGTPYADGAEVTLTEDLTLYAQWRFTEITSVEATEQGGAAAVTARLSCADKNATVWAARYDGFGRFLGAEREALLEGVSMAFTVLRGEAKRVRFFILSADGTPLCAAKDAPDA